MSDRTKPVVLIVRDGWGKNPHPEHDAFNAVKLANTPKCDALLKRYPWTLIHTSGEDVGLPEETMGNSEVGHQNIGAGRVVDQESVRITKAIRDGSFFDNHELADAVENATRHGHAVHLIGICSDAGVHGLMDHLYACLELCKKRDADRVYIHLLMDGRDTGPFTGKGYAEQVRDKAAELGVGQIATVIGRYWAMDRDNRWERVKRAYDALTGRPPVGDDVPNFPGVTAAVQDYYDNPTNDSQNGDEFITPRTVGNPAASRIADGDTVIFYNYRGDRPREITKAFVYDDAKWADAPPSPDSGKRGFDRGEKLGLRYVTMTAYEEGLPVRVAFPKPPKMNDIGGQYLSEQGLTQFRCAETEKFPHVTFFFNDYREQPFDGESREMAQSPKAATYDLQPEMSARRVTDLVLERVQAGDTDVIIVNFANGDMVGHTGKLDAAVKAVETVDACVGEIVDATMGQGGKLIVTADHGNAEQMFDPDTDAPHTAHTLYDVECIIVADELDGDTDLRNDGRLADIFPTLLDLLGLDQPDAMTGRSLLDTITDAKPAHPQAVAD